MYLCVSVSGAFTTKIVQSARISFSMSVCPSVFAYVTNIETAERIFMTSETVSKSYTKIS